MKYHVLFKDTVKAEYVKTIKPYSTTPVASDALFKEISTASPDVDSALIKEIVDIISEVFAFSGTGAFQMAIVEKLSEPDNVAVMLTPKTTIMGMELVSDVLGPEIDPKDLEVIKEYTSELVPYIIDLYMRDILKSGAPTLGAYSKATAPPTPGAGATEASGPNVDEIIKYINDKTKADVAIPKETLKDYKCNKLLYDELSEIVDFFENSKDYKSKGIVIPKGVLFKGPPGTGKTFAAKCIAGSTDCYFLSCTASALQGQYIGSGSENIRTIFKAARALSNASKKGIIIFIDEIDSFGNRNNRGSSGGEEDRTLNQLLAEMSGFGDDEDIMLMAATNFVERLDEALMRSGRFGRQINIDYPEETERRILVEHYFNKLSMPLDAGVDYDEITGITESLTPADIKELSNESAILSVRHKLSNIPLGNINEAVNRIITKSVRGEDSTPKDLDIVTTHECGHVLANYLYSEQVPIKVTNYPYGDIGGFAQPGRPKDKFTSKGQYLARVKGLLGGRAAEQALLTDITIGASDDFKRAIRMIEDYFKIYRFETYEVKDFEQIVQDKVNSILEEIVEDFAKESNKEVLIELIEELISKRVLLSKDIIRIFLKFGLGTI